MQFISELNIHEYEPFINIHKHKSIPGRIALDFPCELFICPAGESRYSRKIIHDIFRCLFCVSSTNKWHRLINFRHVYTCILGLTL